VYFSLRFWEVGCLRTCMAKLLDVFSEAERTGILWEGDLCNLPRVTGPDQI